MTLSSLHWQQFTEAAAAFAQKWANEINEKAEAKSFWDGFFAIFGLDRYRLARHEQAVHRPGRGLGYIDLFWRGKLLVEHKSAHKDKPADWLAAHLALDKAVDASYGLKRRFASEAKRVAWLFELYGEMVKGG